MDERLIPTISNDWFSVSANEWIDSENRDPDPDARNPRNFIIVIIQFQISANKTDQKPCECEEKFDVLGSQSDDIMVSIGLKIWVKYNQMLNEFK